MLTVSDAEFLQDFGRYQDEALKQPIAISHDGRDRLVVLAVEDYEQLLRRVRQPEFNDGDVADAEDVVPVADGQAAEVDRAISSMKALRKGMGRITPEELRSAREEGRRF